MMREATQTLISIHKAEALRAEERLTNAYRLRVRYDWGSKSGIRDLESLVLWEKAKIARLENRLLRSLAV
jgi:hypothetical protein